MGGIMIDWNIRVGDILVVISLMGTGVVFSYRTGTFTESVRIMQRELEGLKLIAKSISDVLTTVAVQKNDIAHIQDDIREMKHLRGFVIKPKINEQD